MKILLAVDGSPCSDAAVEEVGHRPWPEGSSVKVLSAFELPTPLAPLTPAAWSLPLNYFEEMDVALHKQAQIIVDHALEKLKSTLNKTIAIEQTSHSTCATRSKGIGKYRIHEFIW
jgi:hypothetical protein